MRRWSTGWALLLASALGAWAEQPELIRLPAAGLQPQAALDSSGALHLLYFKGEPAGGDLYYIRRAPSADTFSAPVQVNSQPGSAIAVGTIRGGHLALGQRVHVAWMGAGSENEGQMCYARSDAPGKGFEPQRNLIHTAYGLDGGGSVAADGAGQVYVSWHAGREGEETRRVWVARSADEGRTFAAETRANPVETGACGCCGMRAAAGRDGALYLLYRAATGGTHRDMHLLVSADQGRSFGDLPVHPWELRACPMSSAALTPLPGQTLLAWETAGQVYWAQADQRGGALSPPVPAPGEGRDRKHPALALNARGQVLLVWTEGTGWNQGGALAWQLYEADGKPGAEQGRLAQAIPVWSYAAAVAAPDGRFILIY